MTFFLPTCQEKTAQREDHFGGHNKFIKIFRKNFSFSLNRFAFNGKKTQFYIEIYFKIKRFTLGSNFVNLSENLEKSIETTFIKKKSN